MQSPAIASADPSPADKPKPNPTINDQGRGRLVQPKINERTIPNPPIVASAAPTASFVLFVIDAPFERMRALSGILSYESKAGSPRLFTLNVSSPTIKQGGIHAN